MPELYSVTWTEKLSQAMVSCSAILLVAVFVAASMVEVGQAVCCIIVRSDYCADCKMGTPYCGVGSCNIFGCACQGGCRKSEDCVNTVYRYDSLYSYCTCDKKRAVDNVSYARAVFSDMDRKRVDQISEEEFTDVVMAV
ncbi:uncharacterized protein LOC106160243 [Lingula anatina]|uniref:Uncharacterized protein LOC106160243 n=1 Tax=Lingula anatina TaxID=7574 RepID=A0A1S3I330_LINAN|nr:uncharacterized protein LOC106160243 [Lingula anatina]|eukprot:XP_013392241.1 uncharacterized protein LOC106160243 [Lingula anatina]